MLKDEAIEMMNAMGKDNVPFVFIINYDMTDCRVWTVDDVPDGVLFNFEGFSNDKAMKSTIMPADILWDVKAETEEAYRRRFDIVQRHLRRGDSYLVNLTSRMEVATNLSLRDIYRASVARYKVCSKDEFVCFSPETFLQINGGKISCCPMKETIPADAPDAAARLMASRKEAAEHATIVDLIRNDLSMVATHVTVESYRKAMSHFFPDAGERTLADILHANGLSENNNAREYPGVYKVHVDYSATNSAVVITTYHPKRVESLQLVDADIDYSYKYADRTALTGCLERRGDCDDVIIVRNGLLTDASYSNIALYDGEEWLTPRRPLLAGTMRAYLLDRGLVGEADIRPSDLRSFSSVSLINAMLPLGKLTVPTASCVNIGPAEAGH